MFVPSLYSARHSTHPNERREQCVRCLRPAELVPEIRGTPAELCAKSEILNSTAAQSEPSDFARVAVGVMSDRGCVRGAPDASVGEPKDA